MMNNELQMANGERSIDEMRMPNRAFPTSTFQIQHSSFHPSSNQSGDCHARPPIAKRLPQGRQPFRGALAKATATKSPKAKPQSLPSQRDIRKKLTEANREMPNGELRFPNGTSVTSTFALRPSNFAPALPGQLFGSNIEQPGWN